MTDVSPAGPIDPGPGRRVLVTGAASGLGAALVRAFAARGDRVLATDVTGRTSYETWLGSHDAYDVPTVTHDITSDDHWAAAVAAVEQAWGGLDVLVNNAGIAGGGRLDVATVQEWQHLFEVNLFGAVRGLRAFTPVFKGQRSGQIVNIASLAGLVHPAGMASYNAVKAAVVALTETAGHELAPFGVRAMAVCPSYFRTGLVDAMQGSDEAVGRIIARLVAESPVSADDIAAAILDGVDQGVELLLPDEAARAAHLLKTDDRAAYDAVMRAQAAKLEAQA